MVLNDRKDERMALNKKGGLGKGLGKGIDSLIKMCIRDSCKADYLLGEACRFRKVRFV